MSLFRKLWAAIAFVLFQIALLSNSVRAETAIPYSRYSREIKGWIKEIGNRFKAMRDSYGTPTAGARRLAESFRKAGVRTSLQHADSWGGFLQTDNAGVHSYTYDNVNRLTAASHPNQPNAQYQYDAVGNRTSFHRAYTSVPPDTFGPKPSPFEASDPELSGPPDSSYTGPFSRSPESDHPCQRLSSLWKRGKKKDRYLF